MKIERTAEEWVVGVGPGWRSFLTPVIERLLELGCDIFQVKEKFGGLRLYASALVSEDGNYSVQEWANELYRRELTEHAEWMAWRTCEECGSTKDVTTGGNCWIKTNCAECRANDPDEEEE